MAAPVLGSAQEIEHTASRRSGPRRWLRAVGWWIAAADLHPRTGATVERIARDLAGRMHYDTGHARYCLEDTAARLGLDKATVKRRVKQLREAGLLAWVQHGTKTNIRRLLGLPGYAGTATVYAAVIPPEFDAAHGYRRIGTGYTTRVVACRPDGATPVAPPSLSVVKGVGQVKVVGGSEDTSRQGAMPKTIPLPRHGQTEKRSKGGGGSRRSPAQVARDCRIAAMVRPRVTWTQGEGLRRLAHSLRPLIDAGLDVHEIAAELASWWLTWRPARPAAYIRAQLARQATREAATAAERSGLHPLDNAEMRAWLTERAAVLEEQAVPRTDDDRRLARAQACADLQVVVDHVEEFGADDALDLYGTRLVSLAVSLSASSAVTIGGMW